MDLFFQARCSPEGPLKAQVVLGEVMSLRMTGARTGVTMREHIRSRGFPGSGVGGGVDLHEPQELVTVGRM